MNWGDLDKSQRMQLKALICILGLILIVFLFLGNLLRHPEEPKREELIHIPVVETFKNVWLMEADSKGLLIYRDGREESYLYNAEKAMLWAGRAESVREQLADVTLVDGAVDDILIKTDKITGTVLSADESYVELEGYGRIPLAKDYKGYRIFRSMSMCRAKDVSFGYAFADFVMENGEVCGILLAKEEAMEQIRVLLKTSDYAGIYHETIVLTGDCDYVVQYGDHQSRQSMELAAGQELEITPQSEYFVGDRIIIMPKALTGKIELINLKRSQGTPGYRGQIELIKTKEGIVIVNQLPLEEYLYCVVPSEMPVSYPDEALKAQAICARTYAYEKMLSAGYPQYGAHVDDSTSYQVYNNTNEKERSTTAVKESHGQLLCTPEGEVAETYYYSTSCGLGSDAAVWSTEAANVLTYLKAKRINRDSMQETVTVWDEEGFKTFITGKDVKDFEVTEGWYRWSYQVKKLDTDTIYKALKNRYKANPNQILTQKDDKFISKDIKEFSRITDIYIAKRGNGGYADELILVTNKGTYKVITQYNIRAVLNNGESMVIRQDGSEVVSKTLLPSAFISLSLIREKENVVGYSIYGGGYGHGVGMSQNAAKAMAESGYTAVEILKFFYDGCYIQNVYEERNG